MQSRFEICQLEAYQVEAAYCLWDWLRIGYRYYPKVATAVAPISVAYRAGDEAFSGLRPGLAFGHSTNLFCD